MLNQVVRPVPSDRPSAPIDLVGGIPVRTRGPWVLSLYDVLRERGHQVFVDQVVLKAGDPLTRILETNLQSSQTGVLVWSSAAADSEWVRDEYEAMRTLQKEKPGFRFVPVRLDDAELPLFAKGQVFLDFMAYPDGPNGGELLRLLHSIVGLPLSDEAARFASEQDEVVAAADGNGNIWCLRILFILI